MLILFSLKLKEIKDLKNYYYKNEINMNEFSPDFNDNIILLKKSYQKFRKN